MRKQIEQRMRRLAGASPEARARMNEEAGSQLWWVRCWNCRKQVSALRRELTASPCPHCGSNLGSR